MHVDQLFDKYKSVKVIRNRFTKGQSNSLLSGIKNSNYDYICTLDADGQNPPTEIFKLISEFSGVNYTSNLDIIRVSPDHGTAYDIVGKKNESSLGIINSFKFCFSCSVPYGFKFK